MAKNNEIGGIWRTVGGRRIFIKEGQNLSVAMKESGKFNSNSYSKEEKQALIKYISPDSITLNEKLRNNETLTKDEKDWVTNLDKALQKTKNYEGLVIRDMQVINLDSYINNFKLNDVYSVNQYLSFSTGKVFNEYANIKIYIRESKTAKDLTKINTIGEDEVLYERNKQFKILNINKITFNPIDVRRIQ